MPPPPPSRARRPEPPAPLRMSMRASVVRSSPRSSGVLQGKPETLVGSMTPPRSCPRTRRCPRCTLRAALLLDPLSDHGTFAAALLTSWRMGSSDAGRSPVRSSRPRRCRRILVQAAPRAGNATPPPGTILSSTARESRGARPRHGLLFLHLRLGRGADRSRNAVGSWSMPCSFSLS